ncbi:C6 finger domain-containing protein [Histoplasma ohiense]|nr:C6 finger domain-containing protein [Histoplasma ohiense (nom. inval.)]
MKDAEGLECVKCKFKFTQRSSLVRHTRKCVNGQFQSIRQKACRKCSAAKTRCDLSRPTCSRCSLRNTICRYPTSPRGLEIGVGNHGLSQEDNQRYSNLPQGNATCELEPLGAGLSPDAELSAPENQGLDLNSLLPPDLGVLDNELTYPFGGINNLDTLDYNYALIKNMPGPSRDEPIQIWDSAPSSSALGAARHSVQFILRVSLTWPRMMAKGTQLPPIIHPRQLSNGNIPLPLAHCFSLAKMWDGQCRGGAGIVEQTVRREIQEIASLFRSFDEGELIAAVQALTIYTLILLFPCNEQTTVSLLDDKLVKHLKTIIHYVLSTGMVIEEEINRTRPLWDCWISVTCKRRAVMGLYCIYWAYSAYHGMAGFDCSELNHIPAPAPKYLWQATNKEQWESLYNRWLAQWDGPYYRQGELFTITPGARMDKRAELWFEEVDEFGMLFATSIKNFEREPEFAVSPDDP